MNKRLVIAVSPGWPTHECLDRGLDYRNAAVGCELRMPDNAKIMIITPGCEKQAKVSEIPVAEENERASALTNTQLTA